MNKRFRFVYRLVVLLCVYLSISSIGSGQSKQHRAPKINNSIDRRDLESFVNNFFAEQMPKYKVPGAVFVLVMDGKIFLSNGFGYADTEKRKPVEPDKTLFRAYSVSKSFTATAVMQLVEQGKLKLDEDINKYLKRFQIKDDFSEPVILADLLTHHAGYTDSAVETLLARGKYRVLDLGEYLKENLPPRARPPGTFRYSNFGASLAGFIVEEVSGEPFANYVEKHILQPLGMRHSTFLLPSQLPAKNVGDFAYSYALENDASRRMGIEEGDFSVAPAANLMTTADDMGRFMIAQLQYGKYKRSRILSEESVRKMQQPWLSNSNSPKDFGYGFFWRDEADERVMFHAGGHQSNNISVMQFIPARNAAFFLAYTHGGIEEKRNMRAAFAAQLMKKYFGEK